MVQSTTGYKKKQEREKESEREEKNDRKKVLDVHRRVETNLFSTKPKQIQSTYSRGSLISDLARRRPDDGRCKRISE